MSESDEAPGSCPISSEFLPPNMRKHVDAGAPVPLRMMAAKGLVPLAPADMAGALFMLTFDADPSVRTTAAKTTAGLPDRILSTALRDEGVKPPVLAYLLGVHEGNEAYAEMLLLNASTPDAAVALTASRCSPKIAELVGQNQLRLLRHEDIVRQLCKNPSASPALLDGVCDFAVRSGLVLDDVPQMREARVRIFGPSALASPPDPGPTAEQVLQEYQLTEESAQPLEERKRMTLAQRVMKMNVAEKIKLATKGNKEARSLLLRDTNKLVSVAVIRSPRITDAEVMAAAQSRAMNEDVLRIIFTSREWTKSYPLRLALVRNPKVPQPVALKFLGTLRESELKTLARDKNVPNAVQGQAKKMMDKKNTPQRSGGGH